MHMHVPRQKVRWLVALVGMPAAGKTKIGKLLAEHLGCEFVDTDDRIVAHFKAKCLQDVVDLLSPSEFVRAEELVVVQTATNLSAPTIIATGGSAVYSERAMEYLSQAAHVIHLRASLEVIEWRIERSKQKQGRGRGLVLGPDETIADLYHRRMPLYERWAHREVKTDKHRSKIAKRLAAELVEQGAMPVPVDA